MVWNREKRRQYEKDYWSNPINKLRLQRNVRRKSLEVKKEVLSHYSNGVPRCASCGETDIIVLCLDHIDGTGAQQRRSRRLTGIHLYCMLRREGFPLGFQVLCFNCNTRKQFKELHYLDFENEGEL